MDAERKLFRKTLKEHGYFNTAARYQLFLALQKHSSLSSKRLISLLQKQDRSTVYRNILLFEQIGIVSKLWLGWESKIELSDVFQHHHHHFTCLKCLQVINLPEDTIIEKRIRNLGIEKGLKITDHQLEIRGLCKTCQVR
jgi:Fe2+ or Zn2+ uptake regulation protein